MIPLEASLASIFDPQWYRLEAAGDLAEGEDPFAHYLEKGGFSGLDPHPLFHSAWYLETYPDVAAARMNPLVHYVRHGAAEGRDPSRYFSSQNYLRQNQDVRAAGSNPLVHYIVHGRPSGRETRVPPVPLPLAGRAPPEALDVRSLFDGAWYAQKYGLAGTFDDLFESFKRNGALSGLDPNPLFQSAWYLERNAKSIPDGVDPLTHYFDAGAAAGMDPSPFFETRWYLDRNRDVRRAGQNPLAHYLHYGRREMRFPTRWLEAPLGTDSPPPPVVRVSDSFDASDFDGLIPGYTTLHRMITLSEVSFFTTPDIPRWVLSPIEQLNGSTLPQSGEFMVMGGRRVIFTKGGAWPLDLTVGGMNAGWVLPTFCTFSAGPILPSAVYLGTDDRWDSALRRTTVLGFLQSLPADLPRGAAFLVDPDLPPNILTLLEDATGRSGGYIIRLQPNVMHRVRRLSWMPPNTASVSPS